MTRFRRSLTLLAVLLMSPAVGRAETKAVAASAEFAHDPLAWYDVARAPQALRLAPAVLADPATSSSSRQAVLLTVGAIHMSKGRVGEARAAFAQILDQEPWAEIAQPERVPRPAWALFSRMRDSLCTANMAALVAQGRLGPSIRTIAIGDLEDNSLVHGTYDMGAFARGLIHVLSADLREATDLKVVERQQLEMLRQEIGVAKENSAADPSYRVKVGQLYGAQSFLFGQIMQTEKTRVRLDLRWVNTATGEVLLADGAEGGLASSADLFKLERRVLLELIAPRMKDLLKGAGDQNIDQKLREYLDRKQQSLPSGNGYAQYMSAVGTALESEAAGQEAAAAGSWAKAAKLNPADRAARARAATLATSVQLRKG